MSTDLRGGDQRIEQGVEKEVKGAELVISVYSGCSIGVWRNIYFKFILKNLAPLFASEMTLMIKTVVPVKSVVGKPEPNLYSN